MNGSICGSAELRFRCQSTDLGESDLSITNENFETINSEQGFRRARRHAAGCYRRRCNKSNGG